MQGDPSERLLGGTTAADPDEKAERGSNKPAGAGALVVAGAEPDTPAQMALPHPFIAAYMLCLATIASEVVYLPFSAKPGLKYAGAFAAAAEGGSICRYTTAGVVPSAAVTGSPVFWGVTTFATADIINAMLSTGSESCGPMKVGGGAAAVADVPFLRNAVLASYVVAGCASFDGAVNFVQPSDPLWARGLAAAAGGALTIATSSLYVMTYPMDKMLQRYHDLDGFAGLWANTSWAAKCRMLSGTVFRAVSLGYGLPAVAESIVVVLGGAGAPLWATTPLGLFGGAAGIGINLPSVLSDAAADLKVRRKAAAAGRDPGFLELLFGDSFVSPGEDGARDGTDYAAQVLFYLTWALRTYTTGAFLYSAIAKVSKGSKDPAQCQSGLDDVKPSVGALATSSTVMVLAGVIGAANRQGALKPGAAEGIRTVFGCIPRCSRTSRNMAVARIDGTVPTAEDHAKARTEARAWFYELFCGMGCARPARQGLAAQAVEGYGAIAGGADVVPQSGKGAFAASGYGSGPDAPVGATAPAPADADGSLDV